MGIALSCRGHPLVGVRLGYEKKRRNLYLLPSYVQRLLALPINSRTATQKPTLVYAMCALSAHLSRDKADA